MEATSSVEGGCLELLMMEIFVAKSCQNDWFLVVLWGDSLLEKRTFSL